MLYYRCNVICNIEHMQGMALYIMAYVQQQQSAAYHIMRYDTPFLRGHVLKISIWNYMMSYVEGKKSVRTKVQYITF